MKVHSSWKVLEGISGNWHCLSECRLWVLSLACFSTWLPLLEDTTLWLRVQMNVGCIVIWRVGCSPQSTTPGWPTTFSWFSWLNFAFLSSWVPSESHRILFIVGNVCLFPVNFIGLAFLLSFLGWCLARLQAVEMYNKSLPAAPWFWFSD